MKGTQRVGEEFPSELLGLDPVGAETLRRIYQLRSLNEWILTVIRPAIGNSVAEIGCGIGAFTELLLDLDRIYAFDINPGYVEHVKQRFAELNKVSVMLQDVQDPLPKELRDHPVDTVICLNVLEHIDNDVDALRHMRDALVPGGNLILLVPALPWLYSSLDVNLGHFRRYSRASLDETLRSAKLEPRHHTYINLFGILGWWVNGRLLRREILPEGQLGLYNRLVPIFRAVEKLTGPPVGLSHIVWARRVS